MPSLLSPWDVVRLLPVPTMKMNLPLDRKPCHSWLLSQNVPFDAVYHGFGGWLVLQLLAVVFIVHVVANSDKLAAIIRTGEKNHCDAEDF